MRIHREKTMKLLLATVVLRPYVFVFFAAFLLAGRADLGWRRTLLFGAWVWPLAWLAEFASTRIGVPFGLYHYTGTTAGQEAYVANVPLMDSLSFTFLAYAAFCLARVVLTGRAVSRVTLAMVSGLVMMLLDVVIDPLAVRGDRWFLGHIFYYPEGGAYFGVPLTNFGGWWIVGALSVGGCLWNWSDATARWGRRAWPGVALYYGVLAFNLVMTVWIGEWRLAAMGLAVHFVLAVTAVCAIRAAALPQSTRREVSGRAVSAPSD
ncbi:MAG: hypothetical protein AUH30_08160 [Candidatus Rokubacteria bacterium 13_1_40CM_68_15]|nr:MAG: hypothetical protein AUH30_08160 [Candidatus Rokubacteria bacterium 13_1_40CM_68_15]